MMEYDKREDESAKCGQLISEILRLYGCRLEIIVKPAEQHDEKREDKTEKTNG